MGDLGGNTQYNHSARGELLQETLPNGLVLTRTYDARGSRTVLVNPDGGRQTYTYDAVDRSRTIVDADGKATTTMYGPTGWRTGLQDASGATRSYVFDAAGRLTQQVEANGAGAPITTFTDTWGGAANRIGRNHDGVVTTWTYDAIYRLTGQRQTGANATFVYDAAGNILTKWQDGSAPVTMAHDAANRLQTAAQGAGTTTVAYDANGNMSTETLGAAVTTYQYDQENRLTGIVYPDATRSTYAYAATGLRRTAQEPGGAQTLFVWDGDDYLQERAASTVLYVVQDGEILAEKRPSARKWYVPDPLGSVSKVLDASLNVTDTFEYWPYGEERVRTGSTPTPFRYVGALGYYRDAVGRLYVRARVLRPDYGCWLTEDPMGTVGGEINALRYSDCRPTDRIDRLGQFATQQPPPGTGAPDWKWDRFRKDCLKGAWGRIQEKLKKQKCADAVQKWCKKDLQDLLGDLLFRVDKSCSQGMGLITPACTVFQDPPRLPWGPGDPCKGRYICFNPLLCKGQMIRWQKTQFRFRDGKEFTACVFLLEIGNWCECENTGRPDEHREVAGREIHVACECGDWGGS